MNAIEWLQVREPGFDELDEEAHVAILHFSLLWSYFEAHVIEPLNIRNTSEAIIRAATNARDRIRIEDFLEPFAHFQARYCENGEFNQNFETLNFRPNDNRPLVEAVLRNQNQDHASRLAALLIIVLRLRNNLFHGLKWTYQIRDQTENFRHANAALMRATEGMTAT